MALLLFQFAAKGNLGVFLWKCAQIGLVFRICHPKFLFDFLADFLFCWIFLPTHFGLVFRLNYVFLVCFSNLLACFCKIIWHHCCGVQGTPLPLMSWSCDNGDNEPVFALSLWCCCVLSRYSITVRHTQVKNPVSWVDLIDIFHQEWWWWLWSYNPSCSKVLVCGCGTQDKLQKHFTNMYGEVVISPMAAW